MNNSTIHYPPVPNSDLTNALIDDDVCPRCLTYLDEEDICNKCKFDLDLYMVESMVDEREM